MAKRYRDIVGDGGSDFVGQLTGLSDKLKQRMAGIKHKVAIMSGKGGVGKSTVTVNLASALASLGLSVGVLDADIYGPSLAQMLGVRGQHLDMDKNGVKPPLSHSGIKVMSMDFFLPESKTPVVWDGPQQDSFSWKGTMEMQALREFLTDTCWGELDYLLIDLPPGTNQFGTLVDLLGQPDGTLVVSIPTAVSRLVVGRSITMITQVLKSRILGVVENMASYYCLGCEDERPLFGNEENADYGETPLLAGVPFDPRLAQAADRGIPFVESHPETPSSKAFLTLAADLVGLFEEKTQNLKIPIEEGTS